TRAPHRHRRVGMGTDDQSHATPVVNHLENTRPGEAVSLFKLASVLLEYPTTALFAGVQRGCQGHFTKWAAVAGATNVAAGVTGRPARCSGLSSAPRRLVQAHRPGRAAAPGGGWGADA